ncbi:MAG: DUF4974 domain-containing protein [Dysgonamonadaceae bacterium]|jgi:ferric-dicitrate binding protein FerR (iron transport regulator)|nr:DUF4974 domain-containing protein [Dysgonamonadaceae bacterium]
MFTQQNKEISILISRYLLGRLSEEETAELQEWRDESKENEAFFGQICSSYAFEAYYKEFKAVDCKNAYNKFLKKTRKKPVYLHFRNLYKYAAVFAFMIIAASLGYYFFRADSKSELITIKPGGAHAVLVTGDGSQIALVTDSSQTIVLGSSRYATNSQSGIAYPQTNSEIGEVKYNTLLVPRGGEYRITLSDGTKVHLNSASELKYPISFGPEGIREVFLKGEAYFEVAKNENQPFYVNVGDIAVKQYGTSFNINAYSGNFIRIVLVQGSVSVLTGNATEETRMQVSQLAEYNSDTHSLSLKTVDVAPYIAWNEGKFIFENEDLSEIMTTLALWYDMDVYFEKDELRNLRFTGSLERSVSIAHFFKAIEFSTEVSINVSGNKVYINKK